jgi:hypothetical protein
LELDHLATEQALHFSIVAIMLNLKLIFFGNNDHKIEYMWLLAQTVCGKLWKNVGDDLY